MVVVDCSSAWMVFQTSVFVTALLPGPESFPRIALLCVSTQFIKCSISLSEKFGFIKFKFGQLPG